MIDPATLAAVPAGLRLAALFVIGLCLGSFVNVVIHRLPRGASLAGPRSRCPQCGATIAWYDNIPLLSYVLLRGRCRRCRHGISWRYPIVELLGGLLTVGTVLQAEWMGVGWGVGLARLLFALALLAVIFIDLDLQIIPDWITLPGIAAGLLSAAWGPLGLVDALLGVLVGAGALLLLALGYRAATGRDGLGMGDVKLMAMVGAFLGWQGASATLLLGSLAGSAVGVALVLRGRGTRRTALPFGTFLAPAAWVVLFLGSVLWSWYVASWRG
ncbi:MAG: prepilin peptidase [Candidatus Eisenbacteria bacterium]|nr:prepilin peptidase [Candidatus Eisenbacteria bacterium]